MRSRESSFSRRTRTPIINTTTSSLSCCSSFKNSIIPKSRGCSDAISSSFSPSSYFIFRPRAQQQQPNHVALLLMGSLLSAAAGCGDHHRFMTRDERSDRPPSPDDLQKMKPRAKHTHTWKEALNARKSTNFLARKVPEIGKTDGLQNYGPQKSLRDVVSETNCKQCDFWENENFLLDNFAPGKSPDPRGCIFKGTTTTFECIALVLESRAIGCSASWAVVGASIRHSNPLKEKSTWTRCHWRR